MGELQKLENRVNEPQGQIFSSNHKIKRKYSVIYNCGEITIKVECRPLTQDINDFDIVYRYNASPINGFNVQKKLHISGISVPEPYWFKEVVLDGKPTWGLGMERINGKNLSEEFNEEAFLTAKREMEKARGLGFIPAYDSEHLTNIINSKSGGVYLIDFENWAMPSSN